MKRAALQACALACERGGRRLFEGVEFALREGDALWLSGGNGSGKTSLLRLLAGLGLPADGEVRWRGKPVRELREEYHRQVLYCGHAAGIKDDLSGWENVVYGAALAGRPIGRAQAEAALAQVGLEHVAMLPAHALSQGQRRRVALAKLNLDPLPPLLLLDEPFTALDAQAVEALCRRIASHLDGGGMTVYTTHQAHGLKPARLQRLDLDSLASADPDSGLSPAEAPGRHSTVLEPALQACGDAPPYPERGAWQGAAPACAEQAAVFRESPAARHHDMAHRAAAGAAP